MPDSLLEQGMQSLTELLGTEWTVTARPDSGGAQSTSSQGADAVLDVRSSDGDSAALLVDLKLDLPPRSIEAALVPKLALIRQISPYMGLMVIAPWISGRSQQVLRQHDINYLDLTGNVSIRASRPAIVIYTQGATKSPRAAGPSSGKTTLAGPRAGRLVRLLADYAPPYRATSLAEHSRLSLSYVSKLLDTLADQLLIRRDGRVVTTVDWPNLLRARAEHLNLLSQNSYVGMLAPNGTAAVLRTLREFAEEHPDASVAVTGPVAARAVAPIAAGGQLMLYVPDEPNAPDHLGDSLGLIPVDEGADVLILRAYDAVVFERDRYVDNIPHVALSQLVLDCLSGTGRMPAEGEALLKYMADTESQWRSESLPPIRRETFGTT